MLESVSAHLERLYPNHVWGETDIDSLPDLDHEVDLAEIADEWSACLRAACVVRPGAEYDQCDYIYILCQGRDPCLAQLLYDGAVFPPELRESEAISERYLRVSLSALAPVAVAQELALTLRREGEEWFAEESVEPGVYSAPLLKRFRKLVSLLPEYGYQHLDMGEISAPAEGFEGGDYTELYGRQPDVVNYLFFRDPGRLRSLRRVTFDR